MRIVANEVRFVPTADDAVVTRIATAAFDVAAKRLDFLHPAGFQGKVAKMSAAMPFTLEDVTAGRVSEDHAARQLAEKIVNDLVGMLPQAARELAFLPYRIVSSNEAAPEGFKRDVGTGQVGQDMLVPSASAAPPVFIDYKDPQIAELVAYSRMVGSLPAGEIEKVQAIQSYLKKRLAPDEGGYEALETSRAAAGAPVISLGEYIRAGVGVCKHNALTLQVALQEMGIRSRYVRGFVLMPGGRKGSHAWNEVWLGGREYIIDNLWDDWNLQTTADVYDKNWTGPRGYKPVKAIENEAVFFKSETPRPRPVVAPAERYPVGSAVKIPRSSGVPSDGHVTGYDPGGVRVDWTDAGQGMWKICPREALDAVNPLVVEPAPKRIPPEVQRAAREAAPAMYKTGDKVRVPRSDGSVSDGVVLSCAGDMVDVDLGGGAHKIVKVADIIVTPPPADRYPIGATVKVPRSDGSVSLGVILAVTAPDSYSVDLGNGAWKTLARAQLDTVNGA